MTEYEYEEWFEKYLGQVETLDKQGKENSPFAYIPKPLRRIRWLILCIISLVVSTGISLGMAALYEKFYFWLWNWISNAMLSLSIGLVASIIIMIYTNIRDKNIVFYSDIIPSIETRIESMRSAYWAYAFKIQKAYQKQDYSACYEAWHINSNTCFVILEYVRFLKTVLPANFKGLLPDETDIETTKNKISDAHAKIQQEFLHTQFISKETVDKCISATYCGANALQRLEHLLAAIRRSLYGLKYNTKYNKSLMDDKDKMI